MTAQETREETRTGIWFSIQIDNEEFVAFISREALVAQFKAAASRESQLNAYRENREAIQSVACRKFREGFPRPIRLAAEDF